MTKQSGKSIGLPVALTFDQAVAAAMETVDHELSYSPGIIRGYTSHLRNSRGKFIRAASLLTCAQDAQGMIHSNGVQFAAAIELLHLATLVHDDIIDDAQTRRGLETLQRKYGKRTAVICGDYLLCTALKTAASIPNKQDYADFSLTDYAGRVCLGELNQHINNHNLDLSVYRYFRIIRGKTAALFEASFFAGAVLCTDDSKIMSRYARLGRYIGMIFQLTDDCIDFELDETVAKKPVQSDYEQGVITLPLIHALRTSPKLREKASKGDLTREQLNQTVNETGGLSYTRLVSKGYYQKAQKLIDSLEAIPEKKIRLKDLLDKAYYGLKKQ